MPEQVQADNIKNLGISLSIIAVGNREEFQLLIESEGNFKSKFRSLCVSSFPTRNR
jgi:hypothetical protein